jgi:pyruvate/2-oxoglutarate dehydrogenase complex dihydrolipoamide dehydrogenase (E3) component
MSAGDEDLARPVEQRLREEGMQVYTGTQLVKVASDGKTKTVYFKHEGKEKTVTAEVVLQALGRRPNIDRLDLGAAKVVTENSGVKVDAEMRTSQPHIFAVGDVNGIQEIVHIAIEQGEVAGHNAVFPDQPQKRWDDRLKTSVVFTDPAIASVGLSEKECQMQGVAYHVASYPFADHGKSMCLGETHGHLKLLCKPGSGEVIGGHIVGPEAGELIHQIITLMHFRGTVHDLLRMPHYHPTLSEIITYPAEELIEKLDVEKS